MRCGLALLLTAWLGFPPLRAADSPAGSSAPLTRLRQVRELSPAEANGNLSVQAEGVLTLVDHARFMCYLQDETGGVYLQLTEDNSIPAGHRLRVKGITRAGRFTPFLQSLELSDLGLAPLPPARSASMAEFKAGFLEGERVALEGRVVAMTAEAGRTRLKLLRGGEVATVWVNQTGLDPNRLTGAEVRLSGVCAGVFNDRNEITDFHLHATDATALEQLSVAAVAGEIPFRPIKDLESGGRDTGTAFARCRGRVTLHWPGRFLFIHDGSGSMEVRTDYPTDVKVGDEIEATGLRALAHRRMILAEASVQRLSSGAPVPPLPTTFERIHARHSHGDPVEVEADVADLLNRPRPAIERSGGTSPAPFIVLRHHDWLIRAEPPPGATPDQFAFVTLGSRLRVAGVLAADPVPAGEPLTYRLLISSPAAITVLRQPSWWTARRIALVIGGSGALVISALGWVVGLTQRQRRRAEREMQRQREKAMRHRDALLELTRLVQTAKEPETLRQAVELVARTLAVARVGIWRLEDGGTELLCLDRFPRGQADQPAERLTVADYPVYFTALRENRLLAVTDAPADPRTAEFAAGYLLPHRIQSLLDVPLRFHGRLAGVLCIEHTGEPRAWDDEEQNFAAAVADQLTILREASERQRTERALREAHAELETRVMLRTTQLAEARDRAEAADRLKSAFLATMSHELRTPLNSIIGFTGILLQGLVGALAPEQKKQLGMVQNSARHLLSLINDVLDISKIEAGQIEVSRAAFSVDEVVNQVAQLVAPLAERKGLTLTLEVSPELGEVFNDRRRVEQVLINLVNNAIKFTEHGGVRIEAGVRDERLAIRVIDTGIGIRAEDLPRLFRPFQQLDSGLARHHEGTGLGLAICGGLARVLGGTLEVESEPGRGSTFTFLLPRTKGGQT